MSNLGEYLKKLRGNKSLRDVQRSTGISHTYLSTLEKGYDPRTKKPRKPSYDVLEKLADYYSIDYIELLVKAGYMDNVTKEAIEFVEPYFLLQSIAKAAGDHNNYLIHMIDEEKIPFEYDKRISPEQNSEKQEKLTEFFRYYFSQNVNNLDSLLTSNNDVYYKDHLLTKQEKEKLLTIIETVID